MFLFRTKAAAVDADAASTAVFALDDIRDIVLAFPPAQSTDLSTGKSPQSLQETTIQRQSLQDALLQAANEHNSSVGNGNFENHSNSAIDAKDEEAGSVEGAESLGRRMDATEMNKAIAPQLSAAKHGFLQLSDIIDSFESRDELEEFLRKGAEIDGRRKQFEVFREVAVSLDQLEQMAKRWAQLAMKYGVSHVKVSLVSSCIYHRKCGQLLLSWPQVQSTRCARVHQNTLTRINFHVRVNGLKIFAGLCIQRSSARLPEDLNPSMYITDYVKRFR